MTRRERLAAIRGSLPNGWDVPWLLADIARLEAALRAAKIDYPGDLEFTAPGFFDRHNAAIDRALNPEGE